MLTKETLKQWMFEDGGSILHNHRHPGVFTGYVNITPERANLILEHNTRNRMVNRINVHQLVTSIEEGLWDEDISKINFDANMILSDGQHRILSVIKSGVPIRVMVTVGVKPSAQGVTDRRGNRTLADDLSIAGVPNAKKIAALTRLHCLDEKGYPAIQLLQISGNAYGSLPDAKLFEHYKANKEVIEKMRMHADHVASLTRPFRLNNRIINILSYLFAKVSEEDAEEFWRALSTGKVRMEDDPIPQLRTKLINNATSPTKDIPLLVLAALIIKAWNYFEKGEAVKQLKYTAGGAHPESFPEIYNPYVMDTAAPSPASREAQTSLAMPAI